MKIVVAICLLCLLAAPLRAQFNKEKMQYAAKEEKYARMKNTGRTLTILGSIAWIAGVVALNNSTTTVNGVTTTTSDAGAYAVLGGTVALGVGIPFWIVGGVNQGRYHDKLEKLSFRLQTTPYYSGLALRYRF